MNSFGVENSEQKVGSSGPMTTSASPSEDTPTTRQHENERTTNYVVSDAESSVGPVVECRHAEVSDEVRMRSLANVFIEMFYASRVEEMLDQEVA